MHNKNKVGKLEIAATVGWRMTSMLSTFLITDANYNCRNTRDSLTADFCRDPLASDGAYSAPQAPRLDWGGGGSDENGG